MDKTKKITSEILLSAQEMFQRYGLAKTTMNDIAKNAGKGKSTLYYYFNSKEEVFKEVIKMEMDDMFSHINWAVMDANSCHDQMKEYVLTKLRMLEEKKNLYRFIIEDITYPEVGEYLDILHKSYNTREQNLLKTILMKGVNEDLFHFSLDKLDVLSELLVSCVRGVEYDILLNGKYKELNKEIDLLISFFMKGLG